ncbi:KTSC domain-containing protein [Streptomyces sp. NRRL F-4489]|uniref:KTSC domain-containing protein n=1 Tax=Streptomyces sp. NRRL F-4489 TaxID=1609095 RepID=UPI000A6B89F7|nr:KTSC domain-containing protein [Streptomyces sp. NRRL F-4489]
MAKKYARPKPLPARGSNFENRSPYTKRQIERLQYQARKNASPKIQERLAAFEDGDTAALFTFSTYPDHTVNPERPRTVAAGYDYKTHTLRIQFRNGEQGRGRPGGPVYEYYRVSESQWRHVRKATSEGRYINSTLRNHPYRRIS